MIKACLFFALLMLPACQLGHDSKCFCDSCVSQNYPAVNPEAPDYGAEIGR